MMTYRKDCNITPWTPDEITYIMNKIEGQYILEIPASNQNLSNIKYFKDIAEEYGVKLRYTEE